MNFPVQEMVLDMIINEGYSVKILLSNHCLYVNQGVKCRVVYVKDRKMTSSLLSPPHLISHSHEELVKIEFYTQHQLNGFYKKISIKPLIFQEKSLSSMIKYL